MVRKDEKTAKNRKLNWYVDGKVDTLFNLNQIFFNLSTICVIKQSIQTKLLDSFLSPLTEWEPNGRLANRRCLRWCKKFGFTSLGIVLRMWEQNQHFIQEQHLQHLFNVTVSIFYSPIGHIVYCYCHDMPGVELLIRSVAYLCIKILIRLVQLDY